MKEIRKLFLVFIMMVPMLVKADMGAPQTTAYDVVITNPDGVIIGYGKNKITVPFDTKVTVNYEYEIDGVLLGSIEYNGVYGEIDLSDAKVYSNEIDLNDFQKSDKEIELYVFKEGAYLYNGPSVAYGKVKGDIMIPVGTTITYTYYDPYWIYVDYNGTKGWLYYSSAQMYSNVEATTANVVKSNNKVLFFKDIKEINAEPEYNSKKITVNIPAETEITYDLYLSSYAHIKYDGKEGWINILTFNDNIMYYDAVAESICSDGIVMEDVPIYKNYKIFNSTSQESDVNNLENKDVVPKGARVHLIYSFELNSHIWNKVKYGNKEVWIGIPKIDDSTYMPIAYSSSYTDIYKVKSPLMVYEEPSSSSKLVGEIKSGETLEVDYKYYNEDNRSNWYYIDKGSVKGWANNTNLEFDSSKEKEGCTLSNLNNDSENKNNKNKKETSNSLLKNALIAGAIALVIGLTTTVIVILVNKKKEVSK